MFPKGLVIPGLLLVAAVAFVAFGLSTVFDEAQNVTGQVLRVEPASVTTISSLTIEDDSGREWTFLGAGAFSGFTPSHLEEHRALRESVTVEYEELDDGSLRIIGLSD